MFYAGAALPEALAVRLRALAERVRRPRRAADLELGDDRDRAGRDQRALRRRRVGCIGVPLPGTTLKLAPDGDKLEIRVSGPNVTPGYFREPELTAAAFDEEGFYRSGDAVKLVDEDDPTRACCSTAASPRTSSC